jgi:hypothetical protein
MNVVIVIGYHDSCNISYPNPYVLKRVFISDLIGIMIKDLIFNIALSNVKKLITSLYLAAS